MPTSWMHAFVDVPAEDVATAHRFWSSVLGWPVGDPWPGLPEFTSFVPDAGAPYVHVQRIDGPVRVHLDLVGGIERDIARLEGLGATRGHRGPAWQAMASPAGLPFTLDVPADRYDAELQFWRAATGWADEEVDAPEFHRLVHRSESPLQLLVQRLGPDDGGRHARAHLDLGTDDLDAEVARVRSLGAHVLWANDGFTALRDPLSLPFCVTANDPAR